MATVETEAFDRMAASPTLTALVPASRIKPEEYRNQNLGTRYIIYFPAAERAVRFHGGLSRARLWDFQVSIFAETYQKAKEIAAAARDTLDGISTNGVHFHYRGSTPGVEEAGSPVVHLALEFFAGESLA